MGLTVRLAQIGDKFAGIICDDNELDVRTTCSYADRETAYRQAVEIRDYLLAHPGLIYRQSKPKRQAFDIVFRCRLNGTEWTARLFLLCDADAFEAMYSRCCYRHNDDGSMTRISRDFFRVMSCRVSADQSRPSSQI